MISLLHLALCSVDRFTLKCENHICFKNLVYCIQLHNIYIYWKEKQSLLILSKRKQNTLHMYGVFLRINKLFFFSSFFIEYNWRISRKISILDNYLFKFSRWQFRWLHSNRLWINWISCGCSSLSENKIRMNVVHQCMFCKV